MMTAPVDAPSREVTLTRVFNAPQQLVWTAWTNPRHLAQWWGPKMFTNPVCELDLRVGGAITISICGPAARSASTCAPPTARSIR
jgi:uncharacterized protein YndB with AHSA1/START domain